MAVNFAFSAIGRGFPGTTNQELSWVLNAYGILFAALLARPGDWRTVSAGRAV